MRPNLRPAERAIGISRQEGDGVRNLSLPLQESLEGRVLGSNDGTRFRVVADTLANGEPRLRRWTPVVGPIGDCGIKHIGHGTVPSRLAAVAAAFASRRRRISCLKARCTTASCEPLFAIMSMGHEAELHSPAWRARRCGSVSKRCAAPQFPPSSRGTRGDAISY